MPFDTTPAPDTPLARAMAQINGAFGGQPAPVDEPRRPARYVPAVYSRPRPVTRRLVARNLAGLQAFVRGHIAFASVKSPADAREHLEAWAGKLNDDIARLYCDPPAHLLGLSDFDLANARDELMAAAGRAA